MKLLTSPKEHLAETKHLVLKVLIYHERAKKDLTRDILKLWNHLGLSKKEVNTGDASQA